AAKLHEEAHHECMIANSVNFPITCEASFSFAE
ncbi:OsmC family peroxiredoxin, partial [Acinetobacter baumannii]